MLGIFIWFGIGQSLQPFKKISQQLSQRKTIDLSSIDENNIPNEVRPLTSSVNQLFAQMKTAFDTERRFTSDAAHELRTPLAALKTHAEVALKADNYEEQRKALSQVVQGVNRATRLVEQLLTLARLDPDTGFSNIRRFDLFIVAEDVLSTQAILAIGKNIEISLAGTRGKFVAGNSEAIGVLMRNLIDNAIRYTPRDGEVEVSIARKKNTIIWTVADSGPGIPVEERGKIFNRFYRSLGTKESGSGLGLSIVTRIADLHYLTIQLNTSKMGGLQIDILFSAKDHESTGTLIEPAKPA
ncbi:MAG: ATP-binding protein [Thiomicrorhabdus sp.]|nr:ATP-binding protein [Thiomicrorhabdus sp.]